MNLLEQWIVEVHSVTPHTESWTKEFPGKSFLSVDVTTTCYGRDERKVRVWTVEEWEKIQKQEYFLG